MSRRATPLLVEDIWEAIEKIDRYVAGLDHDAFIKDDKTIYFVVRNLESSVKPPIACRRISKPSAPRLSDAKSSAIVHDYFNIDVEIVWEIIQKDLPNLKSIKAFAHPHVTDGAAHLRVSGIPETCKIAREPLVDRPAD
jgi:uncharacterized protein with HEPN domain